MTILTKSGDKKKLIPLPIPRAATPSAPPQRDAEIAMFVDHRRRTRAANFLVFLMALLVLLMGVLSGVCLYRQYLRPKMQRMNLYIPYDNSDVDDTETFWMNSPSGWSVGRDGPTNDYKYNDNYDKEEELQLERIRNFFRQFARRFNEQFSDDFDENQEVQKIESLYKQGLQDRFFKEDVEIDDNEDESFTDITIPDFKDGRSGRFLHDFINNYTTIVDPKAKRCFIYPLDYNTTMPPKSFAELLQKMREGAYFPDTTVLRQKMRVVVPALDDTDEMISTRTALACNGFKIYKLESFVSGVFKRSTDNQLTSAGMFAEFAGNGIVNVDLLNIAEVEEYEKKLE